MLSWLSRLVTRPSQEVRIDDDHWDRLSRRVELLRRLDDADLARLRSLCEAFLARKTITAAAGLRLDDDRCLKLAALCCLPVLKLGGDWLRGWRELIVYPGQFRVRREQFDESTGVVAEWDDALAGESWDRGPVVISWNDVRADLRRPGAGVNVLIHEIAHKLDVLDGSMDGMPPLPAERREAWRRDFQQAFDALQSEVDRLDPESELTPAGIDPYGAEAPDEFFAVMSEMHFSNPQVLRDAMPAVAAHLAEFYGASPMDQPRKR